jgi:hypothetical protein
MRFSYAIKTDEIFDTHSRARAVEALAKVAELAKADGLKTTRYAITAVQPLKRAPKRRVTAIARQALCAAVFGGLRACHLLMLE